MARSKSGAHEGCNKVRTKSQLSRESQVEDLLVYAIIFFAAIGLIYMTLTKRGRGAMFGGEIVNTHGGVNAKRRVSSSSVTVHAVDADSGRLVGLELRITGLGSYQMIPMSIPESEARQLARLIVAACEFHQSK